MWANSRMHSEAVDRDNEIEEKSERAGKRKEGRMCYSVWTEHSKWISNNKSATPAEFIKEKNECKTCKEFDEKNSKFSL